MPVENRKIFNGRFFYVFLFCFFGVTDVGIKSCFYLLSPEGKARKTRNLKPDERLNNFLFTISLRRKKTFIFPEKNLKKTMHNGLDIFFSRAILSPNSAEKEGLMDEKTRREIENALKKRAVGYDTEETVEEFSENDGEVVLTKRKVTKKSVPPDISAAKLLLDMDEGETDLSALSDEQLKEEKNRLLKLLEEVNENESN